MMRKSRSPFPEDEIGHVRLGPTGKGGYEHGGPALCDEPVGNAPRRRISSVRDVGRPSTTEISQGRAVRLAAAVVPEIDHVIYIDLIGADGQRIESMRKSVRHLCDHSIDRESEIESRYTLGIEAAAVGLGAVTGKR